MIVYELQCQANHRFEGWFANSRDFDDQFASGEIACPVCGASRLRKVPSAAHLSSASVTAGRGGALAGERAAVDSLRTLIDYVHANYQDVGARFPEEARRIHYGESAARNIRGVATASELGELLDEGIAVVPVPAIDNEKLN
jgi:hypothetical protein